MGQTRTGRTPLDLDDLWYVPISMTDGKAKKFGAENTFPHVWVVPQRFATFKDLGTDRDTWVVANIQGTGYYRVNYDGRNWNLLAKQLADDHRVIHVLNRAHLISDAFALAGVGIVPYTTPLNLIGYLSKESHYVPWASAMSGLSYVGSMLDQTEHYSRFLVKMTGCKYIRN